MKANITDIDALRAITPAALAAYARSSGWRKTEAYGQHANVFVVDNGPEVLIPHTDSIGDYASAVARLIEIFSEKAEQEQLTLYRDLVNADNDVIRIRADVDSEDGSIAIDAGVEFIKNARRMLLATACAAVSPQPVYRAGANKDASVYMNNVRLGQTEHGSFVVTMLANVPPRVQLDLDFSDTDETSEPMERQVSLLLMKALRATKSVIAASNSGDAPVFNQSVVEKGVSANLCEALSSLVESGERINIGLSWAKTRPVFDRLTPISFTAADAEILKEGARVLRERSPRKNFELRGFTTRLRREETAERGIATVKGYIDEKSSSVNFELADDEYEIATEAHRDRKEVIVRGNLSRQGERWTMKDARVEILPDDDD